MKLSEVKGEKALEMFADLIEPVAEIMGDKKVSSVLREGKKAKAISIAIKNHKYAVMQIMAILDDKDIKEFEKECNIMSLPKKLLDIVNDPSIFELFTSQGQETKTPSGSVTANITESEN